MRCATVTEAPLDSCGVCKQRSPAQPALAMLQAAQEEVELDLQERLVWYV